MGQVNPDLPPRPPPEISWKDQSYTLAQGGFLGQDRFQGKRSEKTVMVLKVFSAEGTAAHTIVFQKE